MAFPLDPLSQLMQSIGVQPDNTVESPSVAAPQPLMETASISNPAFLMAQFLQSAQQNPGQVETPTVEREDDEELNGLSRTFLRGLVQRDGRDGSPMTVQEFNQRFRETTSPAKEILSDVLTGISSSFTGQKFQTARQKAFERQQVLDEMRMRQQQIRAQQQNVAAQVLQRELDSRRDNAIQQQIAQAKSIQDENRREIELMKIQQKNQLTQAQLDAALKKHDDTLAFKREQLAQNKAIAEMNAGDPLWEQATQVAAAMGITDPEQKYEAITKVWQDMTSFKTNAKKPAPGGGGIGKTFKESGVNNQGEKFSAVYDIHGRRIASWNLGVQTTQKDLDAAKELMSSAAEIDQALELMAANPQDVGKWSNALPMNLRALFDATTPQERTARLFMHKAQMSFIKSMTGAAMSDSERKSYTELMTPFFSKDDTLYESVLGFKTLTNAAALRKQYGFSVGEVSFDPVLKELQKAARDYHAAKGSMKGFPLRQFSGEWMLERAAELNGKKIVTDEFRNKRLVPKE